MHIFVMASWSPLTNKQVTLIFLELISGPIPWSRQLYSPFINSPTLIKTTKPAIEAIFNNFSFNTLFEPFPESQLLNAKKYAFSDWCQLFYPNLLQAFHGRLESLYKYRQLLTRTSTRPNLSMQVFTICSTSIFLLTICFKQKQLLLFPF